MIIYLIINLEQLITNSCDRPALFVFILKILNEKPVSEPSDAKPISILNIRPLEQFEFSLIIM